METNSDFKVRPIITRYRPESFQAFIGNEDIIEGLQKDLGRMSTRCFLISGPVGCGKTTLARIIAKELGCSENSGKLVEVNAAEDNGIERMRTVSEMSLYCCRRVFLFDEAHRITLAAQEGALKIFEDANAESFFILCTDKPEKILDALKSRCYSYQLSPLPPSQTKKLINRICEAEGKEVPDSVLSRICEESLGIPREVLKMLDRALDGNGSAPEEECSRFFIFQNSSDLECFRSITKDKNDYKSENIHCFRQETGGGKNLIVIQLKSEDGRQITEDFLKRIGDAENLKVIEMPGAENVSFHDWVANRPDIDKTSILLQQLEDLVENPPELRFPSLRISPDQLITSFDAFTQIDLPERKMIMGPWLAEGSLILLAAPPGVGKSLLSMEIAAACSGGRDAMNGQWPVENPVHVLYVDGEMRWEDLKDRSKSFGLKKSLLLSKALYDHRNAYPPLNIADDDGIRKPLTSIISNQNIKLVILDNLYSLADMDYSFERAWSPINQWLISLRNHGVAVIIVHHTGKKGDQLGTSSRKFNIDISFMLEKRYLFDDHSGNCAFTIIVDKERRPVHHVKNKIFGLSAGKWIIQDLDEGETKKAEKSNKRVAGMLVEGVRNKDIAERCNCSPANISQIKGRLRDRGLISVDNENEVEIWQFTEKGEEWYGSGGVN